MKRTIILKAASLCLFLCPATHSWAATSPAVASFLEKLNGYYYCLSQQGLRNYHCEMTCSLSPDSEKNLQGGYDEKLWGALKKSHFSVDDQAGSAISVQAAAPAATGDPELDSKAGKLNEDLLEALKAFFQFWKASTMEALNAPSDMAQNDFSYAKVQGGFYVLETVPGGVKVTASFDTKGKMAGFLIDDNGSKSTYKPNFLYSKKGYLLTDVSLDSAGFKGDYRLKYGVEGRFWMPTKLTLQMHSPGTPENGAIVLFDFSNFKVNQ